MNHTILWEATDASVPQRHRNLMLVTDRHGCHVKFREKYQSFVLDFSYGKLRCFKTNEDGDVDGPPIGEIEL